MHLAHKTSVHLPVHFSFPSVIVLYQSTTNTTGQTEETILRTRLLAYRDALHDARCYTFAYGKLNKKVAIQTQQGSCTASLASLKRVVSISFTYVPGSQAWT